MEAAKSTKCILQKAATMRRHRSQLFTGYHGKTMMLYMEHTLNNEFLLLFTVDNGFGYFFIFVKTNNMRSYVQ